MDVADDDLALCFHAQARPRGRCRERLGWGIRASEYSESDMASVEKLPREGRIRLQKTVW